MMPRTLACFALALAVLLAALVLPGSVAVEPRVQPLDLAGVREVEVRSPGIVGIRIIAGEAPGYRLDHEGFEASARREGDRLVVETDSAAYLGLWLTLPPTVGVLRVPGARIDVGSRLESLELHTTGVLYWDGPAGSLRVHDARGPTRPPEPPREGVPAVEPPVPPCLGDCTRLVEIEGGRIDRLEARLLRGGIGINRPDLLGEAHLHLGPRAWLSLGHVRDFDNLHIVREPAEGAPADAGETKE